MTLSNQHFLVQLSALSLIAACTLPMWAIEDQTASDPEGVVVTIGEEKLTRAQVAQILRLLPPRQRHLFSNESQREQFADYIVRSKLYTREARKRGLDNRPEIQKVIQEFKEKLGEEPGQGPSHRG